MNPEFDEHFKLYYFHKRKIISQDPRFKNCKDMMDEEKTFSENKNTLTLSCSNSDDDILFTLTLPKYIHKMNELNNLLKNLKDGLDNKGYNFEILYKHKLIDDYEKHKKFKEDNIEKINTLKQLFYDMFQKDKNEKINQYYENRKTLMNQANNVLFQIKNSTDDKKELRRKYSGIIQQLNQEYIELQISLDYIVIDEGDIIITNNNYDNIIENPGIVNIINDNYKDLLQPNKKKSSKNSFMTDKEKLCYDVMCKNKVYNSTHKSDFRKWAVKNHPDKKRGENTEENDKITNDFRIMSDCNDSNLWCPDETKKTKKTKKTKQTKETKENKLPLKNEKSTQKDKDLTINDFKEGMRVEWEHRGKTVQGEVDKINKKKKNKLKIIWDSGDIKEVDISKLRIIK